MDDTQTVLLPTGPRSTAPTGLAERPKSLAGLRIGLLDNGKEFSDVVLEALAETLRCDHGATRIKFWRKGFPAKGAPFIAEMAAETDVAVSGVGHCGSSSPWSVIDAVNLEKAGVPTVALISRSFCPLAQIVARGQGHDGLAIVMLPPPIGERMRRRSRARAPMQPPNACEVVLREYATKTFPPPEHAVARS
jgi:hypothetical protein